MTQNTVAAQAGRKPQKSQFSGMSRALVRRDHLRLSVPAAQPDLLRYLRGRTHVHLPVLQFYEVWLGRYQGVRRTGELYQALSGPYFSQGLPEYTDYRGGGGALCHRFLPVGEFRHL